MRALTILMAERIPIRSLVMRDRIPFMVLMVLTISLVARMMTILKAAQVMTRFLVMVARITTAFRAVRLVVATFIMTRAVRLVVATFIMARAVPLVARITTAPQWQEVMTRSLVGQVMTISWAVLVMM